MPLNTFELEGVERKTSKIQIVQAIFARIAARFPVTACKKFFFRYSILILMFYIIILMFLFYTLLPINIIKMIIASASSF